MIIPYITLFYASVLVVMLVLLSILVVQTRRKHKVAVGDGEVEILQRAVRAQGNFIEYVPLTLMLMFLLELTTLESFWLHMMGSALILGRIFHGVSLLKIEPKSGEYRLRIVGMMLTFATMLGGACMGFFIFIEAGGW